MEIYWLTLGVLAVFRVTHLLQAEDGPWEVVLRLRRALGNGFFGKLLDCFYCLSLWVAVPAAWLLGHGWKERILLWLAFSGAAILLERLTGQKPVPPPAAYYEDEEDEHGLLRKSESSAADDPARRPAV